MTEVERDFLYGEKVVLHGLQTAHMNGKRGRIVGYDERAQRYTVSFLNDNNKECDGTEQKKNIKAQNLQRIPRDENVFQVGDLVEIHGLPKEQSLQNGKFGWITGRKQPDGTYLVHGTEEIDKDSTQREFSGDNLKRVSTSFGVQTLICRPFVKEPSSYGKPGVPTLPLPRRAKLPSKSYDIQHGKSNRVFMELFDGQFAVGWYFVERGGPFQRQGQYVGSELLLWIATLDDDESSAIPLPGIIMLINITAHYNGNCMASVLAHTTTGFQKKFTEAVPSRAKEDLAYRVVLELFRHHASSLPLGVRQFLGTHIPSVYKQSRKKHKVEMLDLSVVLADNVDLLQLDLDSAMTLVETGEELEANGKFDFAANVYIKAAAALKTSSIEKQWKVEEYAAVAFRRANELHKAEEWYLRALRNYMACNNNSLPIHHYDTVGIFSNFLYVYRCMRERRGTSFLAKDDETMESVLIAILYSAGWNPPTGWCREAIVQSGPLFQNMLKEEFRTKFGAQNILEESLLTGAAKNFRQKMLSCLNTFVSVVGGNEGIDRKQKKHDARSARQHTTASQAGSTRLMKCGNPSCSSIHVADKHQTKLLHCPCKGVSYCGKECQKLHWKVHKKYCSFHLAQKGRTKTGNKD